MPPRKNNYVDQIRASFLREFNNACKQRDAEQKQKPFVEVKGIVLETQLCLN